MYSHQGGEFWDICGFKCQGGMEDYWVKFIFNTALFCLGQWRLDCTEFVLTNGNRCLKILRTITN